MRQRIRRLLLDLAATRTIQHAGDGLDPTEHVHILLESLASLSRLEAVCADNDRYDHNFRVGWFRRNG